MPRADRTLTLFFPRAGYPQPIRCGWVGETCDGKAGGLGEGFRLAAGCATPGGVRCMHTPAFWATTESGNPTFPFRILWELSELFL